MQHIRRFGVGVTPVFHSFIRPPTRSDVRCRREGIHIHGEAQKASFVGGEASTWCKWREAAAEPYPCTGPRRVSRRTRRYARRARGRALSLLPVSAICQILRAIDLRHRFLLFGSARPPCRPYVAAAGLMYRSAEGIADGRGEPERRVGPGNR